MAREKKGKKDAEKKVGFTHTHTSLEVSCCRGRRFVHNILVHNFGAL